MTLIVEDTFTESADTNITSHTGETGATWTNHGATVSGTAVVVASTDELRNGNTASNHYVYASGSPANANWKATITFRNRATAGSGAVTAVFLRMTSSTPLNGYALFYTSAATPYFRLYKYTGAGPSTTQIGSDYTYTLPASEEDWDFYVVGGNVYLVDSTGTVRISAADTAITSAGVAGIRFSDYATTTAGVNLSRFRAWDSATQPTGSLAQYALTGGDDPIACVEGPDGNVWVTLTTANKIARVTPTGTIDTFACASGVTGPVGICVLGGNIWYVGTGGVVKISTFSGTPTQTKYTPVSFGYGCCAGPDGNLWVTAADRNFHKINPSTGALTTSYLAVSGSDLRYIASDGTDLYATNRKDSTGAVSRCTTSGTITTTACPDSGAGPIGICYDSVGGLLYVTGQDVGKVYKVTTGATQTFTGYTINASSQPSGVVAAAGRIYVDGYNASYANLYSMPAGGGSFTTHAALTGSANWGLCSAASDTAIWVCEYGADKISRWLLSVATSTASVTADMVITAAGSKTLTADMVIQGTASQTFTAGAQITPKRGAPRLQASGGPAIAKSGSRVTIQTGDIQNAPSGWCIAPDGTYVAGYNPSAAHAGSGSVVVKRSTDGGANWGTAINVAVEDSSYYYGFAGLQTLSNGSIILSYVRATIPSGTDYEMAFKISTDNGATWGSQILGASGATWDITAAPVVEIPDGSGYLLQATSTYTGSTWGWKIMRSTDRGASWSVFTTPSIAQTGELGEPHLTIVRLANGATRILASFVWLGTTNDIRVAYSDDLGSTWSTPTVAVTNATASPDAIQLQDGSIMMQYRNLAASENNYWVRSIDYGVTWSEATLLDNGGRMRYGQIQRLPGAITGAASVDRFAIVYSWETPVPSSTSAGTYYQEYTSNPVVLELETTLTADMTLVAQQTTTVTADMVIAAGSATQRTTTLTADLQVKVVGATASVTADMVISTTITPAGSTTTRDTYANFTGVSLTTATFESPTSTATFDRTTELPEAVTLFVSGGGFSTGGGTDTIDSGDPGTEPADSYDGGGP